MKEEHRVCDNCELIEINPKSHPFKIKDQNPFEKAYDFCSYDCAIEFLKKQIQRLDEQKIMDK